jgi:hypothetical protein
MACCCGGSVCGCADNTAFPASFSVYFEDFSFSVASTIQGTAPSGSVLKSFIEGLSPVFFPRAVQPNNRATYSRTRCSNLGPCADTCPPDFVSIFPGTSGVSTLSFSVSCGGDVVVPDLPGVNWRWYLTMPFTCWQTHVIAIRLKISSVVYSAGNVCSNLIPEFSAQVSSTLSDDTQSEAIDYPAGANSAYYNAVGTARFVPQYENPLP